VNELVFEGQFQRSQLDYGAQKGSSILRGLNVLDIFLCHAGADKAWVRQLASRLEQEYIGGRPVTVFLDEWDVGFGENIVAKVDAGLTEARFCAVVLSPAMLNQDWPQAEWTSRFMSDPGGRRHQLLPILLHKSDPVTGDVLDIPMLLRPIRRYDFSRPSDFEAEFSELLRKLRGERPKRGGWRPDGKPTTGLIDSGPETADDVREMLVSNLLPAVALPRWIWSDTASTQRRTDVWKSLKGSRIPPFWLGEGRLYSFVPLDSPNNPFRPFLTQAAPQSDSVGAWLADDTKSRLLMRLFNDALQEHNYHLRIRNLKDNRKQFYCPSFDGKPRMFRWGGGGRSRTLCKLGTRPDGTTIGIHNSAKLRFITLDTNVFLLIEPGWMFTSDGLTPLEGKQVTVLSTKFGGKERNATVLRNVLMWGMLLANGKEQIQISLGTSTLKIDSVPALADCPVGIDGDSMRLDRIFSGALGGEVSPTDTGDQELEAALVAALSGLSDDDDEEDDPQLEALEDTQ
jgi:hypothetical protein